MYALALIFTLSASDVKSEVIGVFRTLQECESASQDRSSRTQCFFIDPDKGLVDIESHDTGDLSRKGGNG